MGKDKVADIFGERVFTGEVLKKYISKESYKKYEKIMSQGEELSLDIADEIAAAMKKWAIERGATHYTHWFQPLTGYTAEKHVAFLGDDFSGRDLVKGELDASSFPNGGLRATFEARGYTAWDCTSPAFLREDASGTILCIPTAFCSYSGDALDVKTPLLRSMEAVNKASVRLLNALGNKSVKKVTAMCGAEQEYFLITKEKYLKRKDLIYTGRTLFGTMPGKGQDEAAHYSGHINERVGAFMKEVNEELWRSGVPAKIQHNEFAPSQHEICPVFSTTNITTDQNQLIMETLKMVANRHGLECLLHEKPFAGINGSGKHNNWSLISNTGKNLMSPGKGDADYLRFLLVMSCMIKAVDKHADLLRLSASCVGNDYRLGGNEAPPTIISMFIGDEVESALMEVVSNGEVNVSKKSERIKTGVSSLPNLSKDSEDRNRTSPFAFVGNRFEFRMVGSSDSVASANVVLNSIAAEAFNEAAAALENAEDVKATACSLIKKNYTEHRRIIFNGNGYADDWCDEAARRKLPNIETYVDAIPALSSEKAVELFEELGVLSKREISSRSEVCYDTYAKAHRIEAVTMLNLTSKQIIPATVKYIKELSETICTVRALAAIGNGKEPGATAGDFAIASSATLPSVAVPEKTLAKVSRLLDEVGKLARELEDAVAKVDGISAECVRESVADGPASAKEKAFATKEEIVPAMAALRKPIDELENLVDKKIWPFPSYGDMLFEV